MLEKVDVSLLNDGWQVLEKGKVLEKVNVSIKCWIKSVVEGWCVFIKWWIKSDGEGWYVFIKIECKIWFIVHIKTMFYVPQLSDNSLITTSPKIYLCINHLNLHE